MKRVLLHIIAVLMLTASLLGCLKSKDPGIPKGVRQTLSQAGVKKPDLMKTMLTFDTPADSMMLQYSYFLIENLLSNYSITTVLACKNDSVIDIDINKYNCYQDVRAYIDSLENSSCKVKYIIDSIALDIDIVDFEFLVSHINTVVQIIGNTSWQYDYNSDVMMKYVLPYKVGNEPICKNIVKLSHKFSSLVDTTVGSTSIKVNNLIDSVFLL